MGVYKFLVIQEVFVFLLFVYLYLFYLILIDFVAQKTAQQKLEAYVVSGGYTEDLIPRDSCSALEGMFWRGKRGARIHRSLFKKKFRIVITSRLLLVKEIRYLKLISLAFFMDGKIEVFVYCNHSFDMHLNSLGPVFFPFHSWVPSGCTAGDRCCGWCLDGLNNLCLMYGRWHSSSTIIYSFHYLSESLIEIPQRIVHMGLQLYI